MLVLIYLEIYLWLRNCKLIFLGFTTLGLRKIEMFEFLHDYIKKIWSNWNEKKWENISDTDTNISYTDTYNFIIYIKTSDFYEDIEIDVDKTVDTSDY